MPHVAARTASRDRDTGRYQSHRPEQTLLYQIVDEYYPAFAALMAEQGKELPGYVQREFEEFGVVCGRGRNPTLRLWPTIFSGKIDVFPGDRRSRLISSMTSVAPA
ncbi:TPA: hypothetical protein N6012_004750 [Escherichia coli]|nr:hypothetical protein [Escherichia coli]